MCLALHFYQWFVEHNDKLSANQRYKYIFDGDDLLSVFPRDSIQLKNKFQDEMSGEYKKHDAKLVVWWMQMALNFMNSYRGKSTRYLKLDMQDSNHQKLMDYFRIGKVFNFSNFLIATRNQDEESVP